MIGFKLQVMSVVIVYLFASAATMSLSDDTRSESKQQAVYITSDSAYSDGQQSIIVYEGNVELVQGIVKILADKITVHNHRNGINEIVAVGQPARYQQQTGSEQGQEKGKGKDNIVAKADMIKYALVKRKILLQGNAAIIQDGAKITSDIIDYDIDASAMSTSGDKRVEMIIPPIDRK